MSESTIPKRYWADLKTKFKQEGFEMYEKIRQLKFKATNEKYYSTDCTNKKTR